MMNGQPSYCMQQNELVRLLNQKRVTVLFTLTELGEVTLRESPGGRRIPPAAGRLTRELLLRIDDPAPVRLAGVRKRSVMVIGPSRLGRSDRHLGHRPGVRQVVRGWSTVVQLGIATPVRSAVRLGPSDLLGSSNSPVSRISQSLRVILLSAVILAKFVPSSPSRSEAALHARTA